MYKYLAIFTAFFLSACTETPEMLTECKRATEKAICNVLNPEDIDLLPGGDWFVYSEMIYKVDSKDSVFGRIGALNLKTNQTILLFGDETSNWGDTGLSALGDDSCPGRPDSTRFGGHGIDVRRIDDGTTLLAAVNLGEREAIELFSIDRRNRIPVAVWRGCVLLDSKDIHNDVAITSDGSLYITRFLANPHYFSLGLIKDLFQLYIGGDTGFVYHWNKADGLRTLKNSEASAPNGIAISPDDKSLFVAEWGEKKIYRLVLEDGETLREEIALDVAPDNFSWGPDGKLIVTGQEGELFTNIRCVETEPTTCDIPYGIYELDPMTFLVNELHKGTGAASVGLIAEGMLYVGTFAGDSIQMHHYTR